MATKVPGYALAVKIGDKIIAGLITSGFKEKPNYEEVLHKEHAGMPDEDLDDSARELSCSGQTYRRTAGEVDAYEDYETIREAAAAGSDIAFSYYNPQTESEYISGIGKIIDFSEDANAKDTGTYSFTIKEISEPWNTYWTKQPEVTNNVYVGVTIAADYVVPYIEGSTEYQWYRADDAIGANKTAITGATGLRYVVTHADRGKFLCVSVTPHEADETVKESVESAYVGVTSLADYSGCVLWLRGDDAEADANGIYRVPDYSGTSNHALQATDGLKPQKVANALNGRAIINADGIDDYMSLTSLLSLTDFTIFIVNDNNRETVTVLGHNTNSNMYVNTQDSVNSYKANTLISGGHIDYVTHPAINTLRRSNGDFTSKRNGILTTTIPANLTTSLTLNQLFRRAASFVYSSGVAEIVVYNRTLSDAEILEVESILNHRYDVYPNGDMSVYVPELPQEVSGTYIDYKYYGLNRLSISAIKENYVFAHKRHPIAADSRNSIYYSTNGGVSFKPANLTIDNDIEVALIFDNGGVIFGTKDALYYSSNNLSSFAAINVKNTDGSAFVPSVTGNNYRPISYPLEFNVNGVKTFLWGNYTNLSEGNSEVNIWKATDDGEVKAIYKFGQNPGYGSLGDSANPILCRHVHHVYYDEESGVVYIATGDDVQLVTRECHILVAHIDGTSGNIVVDANYESKADGYYKVSAVISQGDYLYLVQDCTGTLTINGIHKLLKSDLGNPASWVKTYDTTYPLVGFVLSNGMTIITIASNQIAVDNAFGATANTETLSVIDSTYTVHPTSFVTKDGYYLLKPYKNADEGDIQYWYGSILVKMK